LVGKGKGNDTTSAAYQHQSTPLSSLRDPSEFAPPPKRVPGVTGSPTTSSSSGALGSTLPSEEVRAQQRGSYAARKAQEEPEEEKPPAGPFKADTTGLSTTNLPPPPKFRGDGVAQAEPEAYKPKPSLPPRLPPRDSGSAVPATPPPAYDAIRQASGVSLNQGAVDRLGRAGISVPGLGIGKPASPTLPPRTGSASPNRAETPPSSQPSQLSELQNRFAHMQTGSSETPSGGTTWAQKRAALETASNFKKDPSSVSGSDLRNAASTAKNFHERHGEQVAAGWKAASSLNQKYGIADRVKSYSSNDGQGAEPPASPSSPVAASHKKPPPPPPPKKHELSGNPSAPPPIPTSSKPKPT
jgi:hypothetical protein